MPARNPEDVGRLIVEAINNGDVEAAIAMYEPEAAAPDSQGEVSSGTTDAFRQNTASFIASKPNLKVEVDKVIRAGDIALLYSHWSMTNPEPMSGRTVAVARRQPDGNWLFIIDDPVTLGA